MNNSLKYIPF